MNAPQIPGLTLRDYFAAAALTGLLAESTVQMSAWHAAEAAYAIADQMLRARPDAANAPIEKEVD